MAPALAAVAVAIVATVSVLMGGGPHQSRPAPTGPPTSSLVGTWSQRVSGAALSGWNGRWRMVLERDGVLTLNGPVGATASSEGASYSATAGRVRVDAFANSVCDELAAGTYAWMVRGDALTVTLIDDPCTARRDLFVGTWVLSP